MSGFVGFTGELKNKESVLNTMLETIVHRGPQDVQSYSDNQVSLGVRQLFKNSTGDESAPFLNRAGDKTIVLDGEIYNHEELRSELVGLGYEPKTTAAAELILAGYEHFGTDILDKLRGMWAFVIYDIAAKKIFAANDHFGAKPLYYCLIKGQSESQEETQTNNTLLFGSEIKSFLPHPAFEAKVNTQVLGTYLNFGFVPSPDTMFEGVYKMLPGSYLEYTCGDDAVKITHYYQHDFVPDATKNFDEWVELLSETIKESVALHKQDSAKVGSLLSGGVDSSYIAKVANDISPIKTISAGYAEEKYSELPYAQAFAKRHGIENHAAEITSDKYFGLAKKVVYHLDEPLADPSCLSLYCVCNKAREEIQASMSGEGADELFAGYNPYRDGLRMDSYAKVPYPLRKLASILARLLPNGIHGKDFFIRGAKPIEQRYFQAGNFIFGEKELEGLLLTGGSKSRKTPIEVVAPHYKRTKGVETVSRMQTVDLYVWMPGDIALKADKMSMANSLQLRSPLLDREVLKLALQIPAKYKVTAEETKAVFRAAARKNLGDDPVAGKKKLGFPVPLRDWLRKDEYSNLVRQVFNSETAKKYFDVDKLNKLIDDHRAGTRDTYRKIWAVYIFLLWHEEFIDS